MVRPKGSASKKMKRGGGVDFKKIKRKIGRKLPPPKNSTNTQIKSKAIVLPEQSMLSERTGMAVNSRGLTLKELIQQTSHHNVKTRKVALAGIRDLLIKHPSELKLHMVTVIEKLRERICDNDKAIREMLYNVLKSVIFPRIKEEITAQVISLLMAYVFNAMTHLAVDIRVMGFKFFHLIVLNHPSSFLLYAEKVLDCYTDIMRNKQLYLEDKSKIKDVLDGLLHCLFSFPYDKENSEIQKKENFTWRPLHAFDEHLPNEDAGLSSIGDKLEALLPLLIHCFEEFGATGHATDTIDAQLFTCMLYVLRIIRMLVKILFPQKDQSSRSVRSIVKDQETSNYSALISLKKLWELFPVCSDYQSLEMTDHKYFILNIMVVQIFFGLSIRMDDQTSLKDKFLEFLERVIFFQNSRNDGPKVVIQEKYMISLIEILPDLIAQTVGYWKGRLLQAFTGVFENCRVDSKLMSACLLALKQMQLAGQGKNLVSSNLDSEEMLCFHVACLQKLPEILLQLSTGYPSVSKVILEILLCVGQSSVRGSPVALEYDNLQFSLRNFFSTKDDQGGGNYGPFVKLPRGCQDIAISCLFYFSTINLPLLQSLAFCFLCSELEPTVQMRMLEVLHSAYKSGHMKLADHIGFLVTIIARFKVYPERFYVGIENITKTSNRSTFRIISEAIYICLSEMGDRSLILKLCEKTIIEAMSMKPDLDNMRSMLRMIIMLDSNSRFTDEASCVLAQYMPQKLDTSQEEEFVVYRHYVSPCVTLFSRSRKLLHEVIRSFDHPHRDLDPSEIQTVASTLLFMLKVVKLRQNLSTCRAAVENILHRISIHLSESSNKMGFERKCSLENLFYMLKDGVAKQLQ